MKPISYRTFLILTFLLNVVFFIGVIILNMEFEVDLSDLFTICILWVVLYGILVFWPTYYNEDQKNNMNR